MVAVTPWPLIYGVVNMYEENNLSLLLRTPRKMFIFATKNIIVFTPAISYMGRNEVSQS